MCSSSLLISTHISLDEYNMTSVLKYDNKRKYWLLIPAAEFDDRPLPDCLVNVTKSKGKINCTTLTLKKLNHRVTEAADDAVVKSDEVVERLLDGIRLQVQCLFRICDAIALLDMIASFAYVVTIGDYIRPDFASTLALKAARHPILDRVSCRRSLDHARPLT